MHVIDVLSIECLYNGARTVLNNLLAAVTKPVDEIWIWLNLSNLRTFGFYRNSKHIDVFTNLDSSVLKRFAAMGKRQLFREHLDLRALFQIVKGRLEPLLEKQLGLIEITIRLPNRTLRLTVPKTQDRHYVTVAYGKQFVQDIKGIPCGQQEWKYSNSNTSLGPDELLNYFGYVVVVTPTPTPVRMPVTAHMDGVEGLPSLLQLKLNVAEEFAIVCNADVVELQSRWVQRTIEEYESEEDITLPLPIAVEFDRTEVVSFFRKLHNRTLGDLSAWKPSWVQLVHFLEIEAFMDLAATYIWTQFRGMGPCCSGLEHFWQCVDASRLPQIHARRPRDQLPTIGAEALRAVILACQPEFIRRLCISDLGKRRLERDLGDLLLDLLLDVILKYT